MHLLLHVLLAEGKQGEKIGKDAEAEPGWDAIPASHGATCLARVWTTAWVSSTVARYPGAAVRASPRTATAVRRTTPDVWLATDAAADAATDAAADAAADATRIPEPTDAATAPTARSGLETSDVMR